MVQTSVSDIISPSITTDQPMGFFHEHFHSSLNIIQNLVFQMQTFFLHNLHISFHLLMNLITNFYIL